MNECGAIYVNMMNRQDVCDRPDTHTGPHRHGMNPNQEENPSSLWACRARPDRLAK